MNKFKAKFVLFLAVVLYLIIYFIRFQQAAPASPRGEASGGQGGWEPKLDLFPEFRQNLDKKIANILPSPQAQLLSGIVLGEKKDLPFDLKLALRDTSTIHMVVVSGQNLSLLAILILKLSGLLTRRVAVLISFLVISFYVILTGGQIPVLRAALMAYLSGIAALFGRLNDGFWALLLVASFMLLINPLWISDLSFQLSFLATFGLIVISPILSTYLKSVPPFLKENLTASIGAQVAVFPVIVQNFHQFSIVSLPANLLTLWTIPYIMIWGLLMLILGSISDFAGLVIGFGLNLLLTYFVYIVKFFASLPFAWEYVGEQVWIVWVGYYLIIAGILNMLSRRNQRQPQL